MRKRIALILLCAVLACSGAVAESGADAALDTAKNALVLMNYGEFSQAARALGMKGKGKALKAFAKKNLPEVFTLSVQTDVAVLYSMDDGCRVAVPVEEPYSDSVMCFVVDFDADYAPTGYGTLSYADVLAEADEADKTTWEGTDDRENLVVFPDAGAVG
ncbi:MAG: hypothetical protein ACOYI8_04440 [Christensenellales bacterium]|jgi:hypothetical protein